MQDDYNTIKEFLKDLNKRNKIQLSAKDIFFGDFLYNKVYKRVKNRSLLVQESDKIAYLEKKFISQFILSGRYVYNISELDSFPCIIEGQFYFSLKDVQPKSKRKEYMSIEQIKFKLSDSAFPDCILVKPQDIDNLGKISGFEKAPMLIEFYDPLLAKESRPRKFSSQQEAEAFF